MSSELPRPFWHWLLLLLPSLEVLTVSAFVMKFEDRFDNGLLVLILSLLAAGFLCLGLGFWWVKSMSGIFKIVTSGILVAIAIAAVNGAIVYAGCAIMSTH